MGQRGGVTLYHGHKCQHNCDINTNDEKEKRRLTWYAVDYEQERLSDSVEFIYSTVPPMAFRKI